MPSKMDMELQLLNAATDREYTITRDGTNFVLTTDKGGKYPSKDELATRQMLMGLTQAARGRTRS